MQAEIWEQVNFPPAPILSSQESVESIQLAPGFRLELVASEPLDNDPVTIAWEKDGRLYAVEMRDYMLDVHRNGEEEAIGRMVVLKYTDDDVVVDKSTVVMDGLVLPRAITIVKGGLLVAKPPNFPVRLAGSHDNQFDISQSRSEKNLRSDAEENAKFLSLPIHDEISGSTRIREVDLLDGSIKDKFKKGLGTNEIPNPPAVLKSRINYDGSSLQAEIPPPGFNMGFLVVAVFICVFELIFLTTFAIPFLTQTDVPGVFLVFAAIFRLIFLGLPTWFLIRLIGITFVAPNPYPSAMIRSK